ncbi:hypothetical protein [Endozoicomonas sp. ALB091]|uniref:hypothetical protein n=1 Tax=Endozoicomonas sp. ALB091 TaxID=3403073 RepID=UPI003BB660D0
MITDDLEYFLAKPDESHVEAFVRRASCQQFIETITAIRARSRLHLSIEEPCDRLCISVITPFTTEHEGLCEPITFNMKEAVDNWIECNTDVYMHLPDSDGYKDGMEIVEKLENLAEMLRSKLDDAKAKSAEYWKNK